MQTTVLEILSLIEAEHADPVARVYCAREWARFAPPWRQSAIFQAEEILRRRLTEAEEEAL